MKNSLRWSMAIFTIALLAITLSVASCSSPTSPSSPSASCPFTFYVSSQAEWDDAVDTINETYDNLEWTIVVIDDFELPGITTGTSFAQTDITVTIRGNRRISLSNAGSLLRIGADQEIILQDVALGGISNNTQPLVRVVGGDLVMQGLASISGNSNGTGEGGSDIHDGGGVRIDNNGSFTMHSGTIKENSACCGGGVHLHSGTFTMIDGIITGNFSLSTTATIGSATGGGGGVAINNGTFNMEGGVISSNQALTAFGGGVLAWRSTISSVINKTGGTIYGYDAIPADLANQAHGTQGHAAARARNTSWRNNTSDDTHTLTSNPVAGWEN